ncbi:MAG: galactokinase [Saprospiraceae bacterium]|nr:galactokinase [Candidatus Defluviibacterium haderslevense]MBK7242590.1 galactokinase [Candidatus Defluviibacterium haderslevense]
MTEKQCIEAVAHHEIVVKSPGRINLIGEHTDYNQGLCLPAAIDRAVFIGLSKSETTQINALDVHNSWTESSSVKPDWLVYFKGVIDLLEQKGIQIPPFTLDFTSTLPSGAGLSSSSAICCGFLFGLNELFNWNFSTTEMTQMSVRAEQASGLMGGMMDQISIFNGKKDHALLIHCDTWEFEYINAQLNDMVWLIVDTKVKHKLVDTDYNSRSSACATITSKLQKYIPNLKAISGLNIGQFNTSLPHLTPTELDYLSYVLEENERVKSFALGLKDHNIHDLSSLLFSGHEGLRYKYSVSCPELDFLVDFAKSNPINHGARMMGGGFGGSTLHLLQSSDVQKYSNEIGKAYYDQFGFLPDIFEAVIDDGIHLV